MQNNEILEQLEYIKKVKELNKNKKMKYNVVTMGCQLNENDSEKISGMLDKMGYSEVADYKEADLIIAIFDSSKELTNEDKEILELIKGKTAIIVLNKTDLEQKVTANTEEISNSSEYIINMSILEEKGLEELYNTIKNLFSFEKINVDNNLTITNVRHKNFIHKALEGCEKAKEAIENKMPLDITAIYLREILENLGNITGESVTDDILDEIFSKFCLGK